MNDTELLDAIIKCQLDITRTKELFVDGEMHELWTVSCVHRGLWFRIAGSSLRETIDDVVAMIKLRDGDKTPCANVLFSSNMEPWKEGF